MHNRNGISRHMKGMGFAIVSLIKIAFTMMRVVSNQSSTLVRYNLG